MLNLSAIPAEAALARLGAAFETAVLAERLASGPADVDAAEDRLDAILSLIEELPCDSTAALRIKARVASWACDGNFADIEGLPIAVEVLRGAASLAAMGIA